MTRSFGIIRASEGLFRLSIRITEDALLNFERLKSTAQFADVTPGFILETSPFFPPYSVSEKSALTAWNSLGNFRGLNGQAEKAIATVLAKTVAGDDRPQKPAHRPSFQTTPTRPQRTQAHPRGYRGTTYKPPKAKSPRPIDLRPHLCDPETIEPLLQHHASATIRDAWNPQETELAPLFRATLLPAVRDLPWREIKCAHGIFHRLRLAEDPGLLSGIAVMFVRSATQAFLWCELIAETMPDRRAGFAQIILISRVMGTDIAPMMPALAEQVREVMAGPQPVYRIACLLRGLRFGVDGAYMLAGFRLANRLYPDGNHVRSLNASRIVNDGYFPQETVDRLIDLIEDGGLQDRSIAAVWKACAKLKGFGEFLDLRPWTRYCPPVQQALMELYLTPIYENNVRHGKALWSALKGDADLIDIYLAYVEPEYQWKFVDGLREMLAEFEEMRIERHSIRFACVILARLCRKPFHLRRNTANTWVDFVAYLSRRQWDVLMEAPDTSFQNLEKVSHSKNTRTHVGFGNWPLSKVLPDFTVACFNQTPTPLFRTMKLLGCLSPAQRLTVTTAFSRMHQAHIDIRRMGAIATADAFAECGRNMSPHLIPPALKSHFDGEAHLNGPRLAHYVNEMKKRWLRACLDILDNMVITALASSLPCTPKDDRALHALQIERGTRENRRALRKLMTAHWSGQNDYILSHPLTQAWLGKHTTLGVGLWTTGITLQFELAPGEPITIALERNPLEALKLGTYVGSCLGLGGILEYSAAANVLDINKQILYARNAKGTVVGRQVVAYSEAGEMVCFSVYPVSVTDALKRCFAEYDRRLAAALGVPIFAPSADDDTEEATYEIAEILSHNWWDDTAWDLKVEDAE